ncbi:MAG: hypothetical protein ACTSUB_00180 [Candidatus Thorarchaeota archaeon]
MKRPITFIVTSNKGGSGKTPVSINLALWGLSQEPPLKVLIVDINHTNQDLYQAMKHLSTDSELRFETAFTLKKTGTAYYLPLRENLHLVRSRTFQPLTAEQVVEVIKESTLEFSKEHQVAQYEPDIIVVDSNYCFPSYRLDEKTKVETDPFIFLNIWSMTSPHELRVPRDYRLVINNYKAVFDKADWDKTNFIHVFSVLEKQRSISSEMLKVFSRRRAIYTVPGSDDLADIYKKMALDTTVRVTGYSFDDIQNKIFSPILAELDSLMTEDPDSYSEDIINARWVERINIFLTEQKQFPLNVFPLPHFYPFLRKAVVDMIMRERLDLDMVRDLFSDFYRWIDMYLKRYIAEYQK